MEYSLGKHIQHAHNMYTPFRLSIVSIICSFIFGFILIDSGIFDDMAFDEGIVLVPLILLLLIPIFWLFIVANRAKNILENHLEVEAQITGYQKVDSRPQYELGIMLSFSYSIQGRTYHAVYSINKNSYTESYYDSYKEKDKIIKICVKNDGEFKKVLIKDGFM